MTDMSFVQCTNAELGGTADPAMTVQGSSSVSQRAAAVGSLLDGVEERRCATWNRKAFCCC